MSARNIRVQCPPIKVSRTGWLITATAVAARGSGPSIGRRRCRSNATTTTYKATMFAITSMVLAKSSRSDASGLPRNITSGVAFSGCVNTPSREVLRSASNTRKCRIRSVSLKV